MLGAPTGEAKRILLLGGRPLGAFHPRPYGAEATVLTPREREIASLVGAHCRREGIGLAALEVSADCLTAVDVTSPAGLHELERPEQGAFAATVIRWLSAGAA